MRDREATVQYLVLTTIEQIERRGLARVTVRAVAEAAEVNVAAINYYFGSKAQLVRTALDQTLSHMLEDLGAMSARLEEAPQVVLTEMLAYLLEGALRYPNVTRAHVHDMFNGTTDVAVLPQGLAPTVSTVAQCIAASASLPSDQALHRAVQAFSAIFLPAFLDGFFSPSGALDTPAARDGYVAVVVSSAFGRLEPP